MSALLDPLAARAPQAQTTVGDDAVLAAMVRTEAAFLAALTVAGVEPDGAAQAARVAAVRPDTAAIAAASGASGTPVLPLLAAIREAAGDVPLLHRGLTSQDLLDTALMVVAAAARARIVEALGDVAGQLAAVAERERHTVVAGRTLGQQAAPTTAGLRFAVLLDAVLDARALLEACTLPAQIGGSVGTAAVLTDRYGPAAAQAIRAAVAAELALAAPAGVWQTDRVPIARLGAALATVLTVLGRLGLEVATLAATEVGEVVVDEAGASSAMPQKRNPTAAVLLVAAGRRAPAAAVPLLGAPLAAGDRPIGDWHAEWLPLQGLLRDALAAALVAVPLVAGLRIDADAARANLARTAGAIHTERIGAVLADTFGDAEAERLVRQAVAAGGDVVATLQDAASEADRERIRAVTADHGPVGLSDELIDAAIARAQEVQA